MLNDWFKDINILYFYKIFLFFGGILINLHNVRIDNTLKRLNQNGFQGMILGDFNNIRYISGYLPTSVAIAIIKENPIVYTVEMDFEVAEKTSDIEIKKMDFEEIIKDLKEEGIDNLAIESQLPVSLYKKFDDFDLKISDALEIERMVKSSDEIDKMIKAANIAHKSLKELDVRSKQENGLEEWDCSYELGYLMRKNGAETESFDTIFASGANSSLPHSIPRKQSLETPVLVDYGCKYQGYCSDTTRTFVYNEFQEEISTIVLEAHDKAIASIKPGVPVCEIDKVARDIIAEYGYGDKFIHSTGHGVGLDIHENPSASINDKTTLENNMIITVEPGIYLEGEFGVRIEDTILVDGKGKILGNLPQIL